MLLALNALLGAVALISDVAERSLLADAAAGRFPTTDEAHANDLRQAIIGGFQSGLFVVTAVFFIAWLHRAYRNLPSVGATDRRYGDGWAVGGWFVPILSLWRPKEIVNDVWRASEPDAPPDQGGDWRDAPVPSFLLVWWLAFALTQFIWNVAFRYLRVADTMSELQTANTLYTVADALAIVSALLAILVVRRTTTRQCARAAALELVPEEDPVPVVRRRSTWATAAGVAAAFAAQALLTWAVWTGALDPTAPQQAEAVTVDAPEGTLVADDFSTRAGGWPTEQNAELSMGYGNGDYRMHVKQPSEWFSYATFPAAVDAVAIEVDAEVRRGTSDDLYGIACWEQQDVGYLAVLYPDGYWAILEGTGPRAEYRNLGRGRNQRAIRGLDESNRLRLECRRADGSATIELWTNGTKLGKAEDSRPAPPFRALALLAGAQSAAGIEVRFDDVIARDIE